MCNSLFNKLEFANQSIAQGLRVFLAHGLREGVCTCGDSECDSVAKHPIRSHLKCYWTDPEKLRLALLKSPWANIAVRTGYYQPLGKSLLVLDEDELDKRHLMPLPISSTFSYKTGKGRHYWFWLPGRINSSTGKNTRFQSQVIKLVPGWDLKCQNNYVIVPPSRNQSGDYQLDHASHFPIQCLTEEEYSWIRGQTLAIRRTENKASRAIVLYENEKLARKDYETVIREGIKSGDRNNTIARLVRDHLRRNVARAEEERTESAHKLAEELNEFCDEPLKAGELNRIVRKAVKTFKPERCEGSHLEDAKELFGPCSDLIQTCLAVDDDERMFLKDALNGIANASRLTRGEVGWEHMTASKRVLLLFTYFLRDLHGDRLKKKRGNTTGRFNLKFTDYYRELTGGSAQAAGAPVVYDGAASSDTCGGLPAQLCQG